MQIFRADRRCIATDAHLAPQFSIPEQKVQRQAILLQKFKGHNATVTSVLVTGDTGDVSERLEILQIQIISSHNPAKKYCIHVDWDFMELNSVWEQLIPEDSLQLFPD